MKIFGNRATRANIIALLSVASLSLWAPFQLLSDDSVNSQLNHVTPVTKNSDDIVWGEIDWSRNIVLITLDLEAPFNEEYIMIDLYKGALTMDDAYSYFDALLNETEKRVKVGKDYNKTEALRASHEIQRILQEEGFAYRDLSSEPYHLLGGNLFSFGLMKKQMYCLNYMLLYLGIAEHLGLPIVGISAPGHNALRWELEDGETFNLEPTVPGSRDDDFYIEWKNISENAIKNGVYLKRLTKREVVAHVYYRIAQVLKANEKLRQALNALDRATRLFPAYADAYNAKGAIWSLLGHHQKALLNYDIAIKLDPGFADAYFNRGLTKANVGDFEEAEEDLKALKGYTAKDGTDIGPFNQGLAEMLDGLIYHYRNKGREI